MNDLLTDRLAIADLAARYCRAIDRRDLAVLRELYAPGGVDHHTGFDGTIEEYISWLGTVLPLLDGTLHVIGNHLAEIHGDVAVAETYALAHHWGAPDDDPARNFTSLVRYVDRLERIDGVWRIVERWAVRERALSDVGRAVPGAVAGPAGTHGADDPLTRLLAEVRTAGQVHG